MHYCHSVKHSQIKIPQNLSKKWSLQKRRSCSSSQMTYTWRLITLKSIMNPNGLRKKKAPGPNGPRSPKITLILGVVIWTPQMSEIEQKIASDPLSNHHQHHWDMIKNDRFDLGRYLQIHRSNFEFKNSKNQWISVLFWSRSSYFCAKINILWFRAFSWKSNWNLSFVPVCNWPYVTCVVSVCRREAVPHSIERWLEGRAICAE